MARSTTFRYQTDTGESTLIDLSDYHTISIHFRFPDGAKLISLSGFSGSVAIPPEIAKDFLHWLAEI